MLEKQISEKNYSKVSKLKKNYFFVYLVMPILKGLINFIISLIASTIIIYAINILAGFAGADYSFSHGETFIIWILMAILVNNCFNNK